MRASCVPRYLFFGPGEGPPPRLTHASPQPHPTHIPPQKNKAAFIDAVEKRDTEDRRKLRSLPHLAVALELLVAVAEWNAELLRGLEACILPVRGSSSSFSAAAPNQNQQQEGRGEGEGEMGSSFDIPRLAELMARSAPGVYCVLGAVLWF